MSKSRWNKSLCICYTSSRPRKRMDLCCHKHRIVLKCVVNAKLLLELFSADSDVGTLPEDQAHPLRLLRKMCKTELVSAHRRVTDHRACSAPPEIEPTSSARSSNVTQAVQYRHINGLLCANTLILETKTLNLTTVIHHDFTGGSILC